MINFYRRFINHATEDQALLHDMLSGPKVKGSHPLSWTDDSLQAFEKCKSSIAKSTLLAHPVMEAPLALVTVGHKGGPGRGFAATNWHRMATTCILF